MRLTEKQAAFYRDLIEEWDGDHLEALAEMRDEILPRWRIYSRPLTKRDKMIVGMFQAWTMTAALGAVLSQPESFAQVVRIVGEDAANALRTVMAP